MEQDWITECWILEVLGVSLQSHLDVSYSIPVFLLRTTLQTGRFLVPIKGWGRVSTLLGFHCSYVLILLASYSWCGT